MIPDAAIGVAIAVLVDVVAPFVLLVPLVWFNRRHRRSRLTDGRFWFATGMYLLAVGILIAFAFADVLAFRGVAVIVAVLGASPMGFVPAIVNSNLIAPHFTLAEWTHFGYFAVLEVFVVGLLPWAALNPVLLRRLLQFARPKLPAVDSQRVEIG